MEIRGRWYRWEILSISLRQASLCRATKQLMPTPRGRRVYVLQPRRSEGDGAHEKSLSVLQPRRSQGNGAHGKSFTTQIMVWMMKLDPMEKLM